MYISHKDKFIFFHTPKTAGSSIHIFFKDHYCHNGLDRKDPVPPIHHMKANLFLKYNKDINYFYKFAFVRNPFDRLVSAYSDFTQIRPKYESKRKRLFALLGVNKYKYIYNFYELEDKNYNNFDDLCNKGLKLNDKDKSLKIKRNQTFKDFCLSLEKSGWIKDSHFMPQSELLCDQENNLLMDFFGKYENLSQDLNLISEKIGINIKIKHHRKTNHHNYRKYFDNETKDIIESIYKQDLDLFNYTF